MSMNHDLIDRHRDINVDHGWWGGIYDDFTSICKRMGISLDQHEPSFTGFWSQGDGASFTGVFRGTVAETAPETIRNYAPVDGELHRIADELCILGRVYYRAHARIWRQGRTPYCHSNTLRVSDLWPAEGDVDDWADEVHDAVEEGLNRLFRDLADWLYGTLEREYDYLTSDEVVWDTIRANELDREEV